MRALFTPDSTRAVIADWIEFELVMTGRPYFTDAMLNRVGAAEREPEQYGSDRDPDAGEHGEEVDPEILDQESEERNDEVWEEFHHRVKALDELYPFELTGGTTGTWKIAPRATASDKNVENARAVYRATLVMSCFRHRHIKKRKPQKDRSYSLLQTSLERQFQHISALAAPRLHGSEGVVYSFGWPREDGSKFHDALKDLVDKMGKGKVKKRPPANASGHEKDGTVDIVTWMKFRLPSVGDPVYFGQVASGSNWEDKPVEMYLKAQFFKWFKHKPARVYSGATFMPFVRHTDVVPTRGRTMEAAMAQTDRDQAATFGTMVDRIKLTELYGQGLVPASQRYGCKQPSYVFKQASDWIQRCRDYCEKGT